MTIVANTVVKYVLHSVDLYSEAPWENKAVFMLYTELFIGLIKVFLVTSLKQGLRTLLRIRKPGSGAFLTPIRPHSVDLYSEAPWKNKAVFMLYTELFIGLIKVSVVTPVPTVLSRGCGFGSGIRCFFDPRIRDGIKNKIQDPGSGMNIPDLIFENFTGISFLG